MAEPDHLVFTCPRCQHTFPSPGALSGHINNVGGSCYLSNIPYPVPSSFYHQPGEDIQGHYYPTSAYVYGKGKTLLDKMQADVHERRREHVIYYPFADEGEWELGKFLLQHLSQTAIKDFLKLKWFKGRERPSFRSIDELIGWVDTLPKGPCWKVTTLKIEGCKSNRPVQLIWRDPKEVTEDLLSNPVFTNYMTFDPHIVIRGMEREYSEFFTGNRAHHIQAQLPVGATIIPIILASDKTPVTRHTGGLQMHPVFMTIGNIQSDVRMQATSHAWRCVAFMPTPTFDIHPDYQTLLVSCVFHQCMDIVFKSLKACALNGSPMTDALRYTRSCYTPLVAYIADLPEQQLIACVAKNASPVTTATLAQFSDPTPHPPCTGSSTLKQIQDLCREADPWDLVSFQKKAKALQLLGVHLPFWRNWRFADPAFFLVGEILHTCHKFFFDHILKWCKEVASNRILDARFKTQHRRVGTQHFTSGVSHIKQMTGREHRDIQWTIVPMISKATPRVTSSFVYCIQSIIEFIYRAQSQVHSDASLAAMVGALREFHATCHAVVDAELEARQGASGTKSDFNIPKLELFQSFARNITDNGNLIQYTADVSERLLITHCKIPFERTSRNVSTFAGQIVDILNHEESIRRFNLYHVLRHTTAPLECVILAEDKEISTIDPMLSLISSIAPEEEITIQGPRPFRNYFLNPNSFLSANGVVAFHVTVKPDHANMLVEEIQRLYNLPHMMQHIMEYIDSASRGNPMSSWNPQSGETMVWHKFRIQQHSTFQSRYITKSQVIQAYPRSPESSFGVCDAVLLARADTSNLNVARVKAVFRPKGGKKLPAHLAPTPLLYVEFFSVVGRPDDAQDGVGLYRVQRPPLHDAEGASKWFAVIPVTEVVHALELIPAFDTRIPEIELSSATCLDAYYEYYVNSFADKETHHALAWTYQ